MESRSKECTELKERLKAITEDRDAILIKLRNSTAEILEVNREKGEAERELKRMRSAAENVHKEIKILIRDKEDSKMIKSKDEETIRKRADNLRRLQLEKDDYQIKLRQEKDAMKLKEKELELKYQKIEHLSRQNIYKLPRRRKGRKDRKNA